MAHGFHIKVPLQKTDETQSVVPDYRYSNDGQERDDEVAGPGNHYTALFTQYDPRLVMRPIPDPKPTIGVSPYVSFGDNPISNVDPLGDSIMTVFYDEHGNQTNEIPTVVQNTFNKEYGIRLGYNPNTHMLFQAGTVKTNQKVSPTAKKMWEKELGAGHSDYSLTFGYRLFNDRDRSSVEWGEYHPWNKTAFIDLADFNGSGNVQGIDFNGSYIEVPKRAYNFARVLEHEYLGHGVQKLTDDLVGGSKAGANEDNLSNPIRKEMGLPERLDYKMEYRLKEISTGKVPSLRFSNGGIIYEFAPTPNTNINGGTPIK